MVSIVGVLLIWLTTSDQILVVVVMSFLVPMQPLAGADPNLKDNLETFFNLKYPKVRMVLAFIPECCVSLMKQTFNRSHSGSCNCLCTDQSLTALTLFVI
jgi:hypothetical protein